MGRISNTEDIKQLYLSTDLSNISDVQSAIKELTENSKIAGADDYLVALRAATPATIAKARKYNNASTPVRYLGWALMVVFLAMAMMFDDSGLFEESTVTWPYYGFYVGIAVQIYIAVLKNAWKKLTLSGAVIHSAVTGTSVNNELK